MPQYWLDADVLINANRQTYSFKVAPGFWQALEQAGRQGVLAAPKVVYREIMQGDDQLKVWVQSHSEFFVEAGRSVQQHFAQIADYVNGHYEAPFAQVSG